MDVNALLLLVEVVDAGSLAGAARRTGVSKSTLSRKLQELEDELGVRLLERTPRQLSLTEPGRRLVERARAVAQDVDEARRMVRSLGDAPRGTVRATASVSFAERFLAPLIGEFLRRHPDVDLELVLDPSRTDLLQEGIDVAIRVGEPDPTSAMIARKIGHASTYLAASPRYLEPRGTPTTVDELSGHDAIVYRPGREPVSWAFEDEAGEVRRVRPAARMTVNSHPMALAACQDGIGLAMLPGPFLRGPLEEGTLVRVLPDVRSPLQWIYALFPHREQPPAVRAFIEFVVARLDMDRWLL